MAGYVDAINKMIADHRATEFKVTQAGQQMNDLEALFQLQDCYCIWTESSMESLLGKQKKLQETAVILHSSLKKHFALEEKVLPPLLGKIIMRVLVRVHRMIEKELQQVETALAAKLDPAKPQQLLLYKSRVEERVYHLCQLIEQHANHEEILLNVLKEVLQVAGYKPGKKPLADTRAGT